MKTNEIWKGLENPKKISLMAVFQPNFFSKWHPVEDRVVKIKQE
jgi:hypothetical protein